MQATAESPTEMSRQDKRIIFAKLEEVYESEETGYKPGWSDIAVARDLGSHIPVGWVASVREDAFGPARDNPEVRDMLERVTAAAADAKALVDDAKAHNKRMNAIVTDHNTLMERAREIAKTLDGLIAIATRIEKVVS